MGKNKLLKKKHKKIKLHLVRLKLEHLLKHHYHAAMHLKTLLQSFAVLILTLLLAACPSSGDHDSRQQPKWHLNDFMSLGQSTNIWE